MFDPYWNESLVHKISINNPSFFPDFSTPPLLINAEEKEEPSFACLAKVKNWSS